MTAKYHYNGILTERVSDWVYGMLQEYPYVVEVSCMPPIEEFDALFADRSWESRGENCMGQSMTESRVGVPYGYVPKSEHISNCDRNGFLFFTDSESHRAFVERFSNLVVNPAPFRMEFS